MAKPENDPIRTLLERTDAIAVCVGRIELTLDQGIATLNQHTTKLEDHDKRFDAIDDRLDRIELKLDRHETRIEDVEQSRRQ